MTCLNFFSADYDDARAKFRLAAKAINAELISYENPAPSPTSQPLTTDVALIGRATAKKVVLVTSGTHGVEGFCGSAAQIGWMQSDLVQCLPDDIRIVLIHAINPSGFAWLRRVTEGNIDLNRNFIDHNNSHSLDPEYAQLHPFVLPQEWNKTSIDAYKNTLEKIDKDNSTSSSQAILTRGQYQFSDGLFYGGQQPTWSNKTFEDIILRFVADADQVGFVDFHTGLGPYGTAELIHRETRASDAQQRLEKWYKHGLTSLADGTTSSAASQEGLVETGLRRFLQNSELTSMTLEFGTVAFDRVLESLRADNWLHINGDLSSPLAKAIKAELKYCFYPQETEWKELVYLRSRQILDRAIKGLSDTG